VLHLDLSRWMRGLSRRTNVLAAQPHRWHIVLAAFSVGDPAGTNDEFDYIAVKPALLKGLP
jgi:hypothetical protein